MKILALIMAFLVLALSVMPCADSQVLAGKEGTTTELTKTGKQQNNPIQDDCSPFCQCSCCAGFSINHFVASVTTVQYLSDNPTNDFLPSEVIEVSLPIWQPPQIV